MTDAVLSPAEMDFVFTRHLDAPLDLVWRAWTEPALIARWWAPAPMLSVVDAWDARPGGRIALTMQSPTGEQYPMSGTFEAVEARRRIIIVGQPLDEQGQPYVTNRMVTTFHEENGGVRVETHAHLVAVQAAGGPMMIGMDPGYNSALDNLARVLAELRSA